MNLIYFIKFDKDREPRKIVAKNFLELIDLIKLEVELHQQPFEWLIREY